MQKRCASQIKLTGRKNSALLRVFFFFPSVCKFDIIMEKIYQCQAGKAMKLLALLCSSKFALQRN